VEADNPRHRAICYDNRGLGQRVVGDGQYPIEGHVDDLLRLRDHLAV
jgi:pimeloyl-ACP methyl ester carboxylesterase